MSYNPTDYWCCVGFNIRLAVWTGHFLNTCFSFNKERSLLSVKFCIVKLWWYLAVLIHSTDHYNYWRIWPKIINWSLIEMIGFNEASKCKWTDNFKNVFHYLLVYILLGLFNSSDKHSEKMLNHSLLYLTVLR